MKPSVIAVDALCLATYLAAANPAVTGISVHEWVGLGAFVLIVVHCIAHYDWFARSLRSLRGTADAVRLGRLLLNLATALTLAVCAVSGVMISGTVLAALGLYVDGYFVWTPVHALSAKVLLGLIVVHAVSNARRVMSFFKSRKVSEHAD